MRISEFMPRLTLCRNDYVSLANSEHLCHEYMEERKLGISFFLDDPLDEDASDEVNRKFDSMMDEQHDVILSGLDKEQMGYTWESDGCGAIFVDVTFPASMGDDDLIKTLCENFERVAGAVQAFVSNRAA